jgi:hypothetical protein
MLITVDIPQENEHAFRAVCEASEIEIQHYETEGPGGGNPCFHLLVGSKEAFAALGQFYWG